MKKLEYKHDALFKSMLGKKEYMTEFFEHFMPNDVKKIININSLKRLNTTFVNPELQRVYADNLFVGKFKGKIKGLICLLAEHKSSPQKYSAIQVLYYLASAYYHQIFKDKGKLIPIIPIIFYHGKNKWEYKSVEDLFEDLPENIKPIIPIFKTVFKDLNNYTDETINSWQNDIISITTLIQKHAFDKEYLTTKVEEIVKRIDNLDDRNLILSIFVYYLNQSEIREENLTKIVKNIKHKKEIMGTIELIEKRGEKRGIQLGEKRGIQLGEKRGEEANTIKVVLSGFSKGYGVATISDVTGISTVKVRSILKKNGKI